MLAEKAGKLDCLVFLWGIIPPNKNLKVKEDVSYFWIGMRHANSVLVNACLQKNSAHLENLSPRGIRYVLLSFCIDELRPLQFAIQEGHKNLFDLLLNQISKNEKHKYLLTEPNKVFVFKTFMTEKF